MNNEKGLLLNCTKKGKPSTPPPTPSPVDLYKTYIDKAKKTFPDEKDEKTLQQKVEESYLTQLELWNDKNFKIYKSKKDKLTSLFKVIILSLVLYSVNITMYKHIKMQDETKKTEQQVPSIPPPTKETL